MKRKYSYIQLPCCLLNWEWQSGLLNEVKWELWCAYFSLWKWDSRQCGRRDLMTGTGKNWCQNGIGKGIYRVYFILSRDIDACFTIVLVELTLLPYGSVIHLFADEPPEHTHCTIETDEFPWPLFLKSPRTASTNDLHIWIATKSAWLYIIRWMHCKHLNFFLNHPFL